MSTPIHLAISTCPNDTFAFHALMNREVDWQGLEFKIELLDIQQLNDRLFADEFDVAKASFHAALLMADQTFVLPSGSALGFGVGPLLLSASPDSTPENSSQLTLCPGQHTTAMLLFKLFYPQTTAIEQTLFSDIMPRLKDKNADFGVCIHEGRFTWQDEGLGLVEDLGTRWESETNSPLPLGGILARKRLPSQTIAAVQSVIFDSLQFARNDPTATLPTMRQHAQEFNDDVLMQHVELYVNDWTMNLGETGEAALQQLSQQARKVGLVDSSAANIEVFKA